MKLLFLFTLFTFSFALHSSKHLEIHFFNVGQADAQLVVFPSGYSIMIDCGDRHSEPNDTKRVAKRVEAILGKKKVDVLVLSHFHIDHFGRKGKTGIWYLIEKAGFTFGKFIKRDVGKYTGSKLSDCSKSKMSWKYVGGMDTEMTKFACYATSTKDKTKLSKIAHTASRCNTSQIDPPDATAKVTIIMKDALGVTDKDTGKPIARNTLNSSKKASENDFSICMKIEYNKFIYATCGDLSGFTTGGDSKRFHDVESATAPLMGEVDLLKVNHHGCGTSTNKKWANTLKPSVSVITCGQDSDLPNRTPMKYLKAAGSKVYTVGDDCNKSKINQVGGIIEMGDDVVVKVPSSGKTFTISTAAGKKAKTYNIKQSKKLGTCKKL